MEAGYVIYLLWDPRNGDIRYIGESRVPRRRLARHRKKPSSRDLSYCANWKRSMLKDGVRCEMSILEEDLSLESANERERWWIQYGKEWHWPLTNLTGGGDGVRELCLEARDKIRNANLGNKNGLGHKRSEEAKARIREAQLGNKNTFGFKHSEATKDKLRRVRNRSSRIGAAGDGRS